MSKAQAAWHGFRCDGACCRHNRHLGVCPHYRVCTYHLKQEANRIKFERERSAEIEFRKVWGIP